MNMTGWFSPKLSGTYSVETNFFSQQSSMSFTFSGNKVTLTTYSNFSIAGGTGTSSNTYWYKLESDGRFKSGSGILADRVRYNKTDDILIISGTVLRKK